MLSCGSGVNLPDHGLLFRTLSAKLCENVTHRVALLNSNDCLTIRNTVEQMTARFMKKETYDEDMVKNTVTLCSGILYLYILDCVLIFIMALIDHILFFLLILSPSFCVCVCDEFSYRYRGPTVFNTGSEQQSRRVNTRLKGILPAGSQSPCGERVTL